MERKLPDTPWHVGYAKKDEDDPRRHKARCVHYKDGICTSSRSNYCQERCGGSSHCEEYSESSEEYIEKLEQRKTIEEIQRDNIAKYKASLEDKKRKLVKQDIKHIYMSTADLRRCLVCDEGLTKLGYSLKKCIYCGMFYVDDEYATNDEVLNKVKAEEVYIMNISKKEDVEPVIKRSIYQTKSCKHSRSGNKCKNRNSNYCDKRCNRDKCELFE